MVNFIQTSGPNDHNLTISTLQKDPLESCKIAMAEACPRAGSDVGT
jgi:hypothetical protein